MVPILAMRYLQQTVSEWVTADRDSANLDSLVPCHVQRYLQQAVELMRYRLGMGQAPSAMLWPDAWLIQFDDTVRRTALAEVATWTLPDGKPKRSMIDSGVIRERVGLWSEYVTLKFTEVQASGKTYSKARGESVPTSQNYFAAEHKVSSSELSRWRSPRGGIAVGSAPDVSIRRALDAETRCMKAAQKALASIPESESAPGPAPAFIGSVGTAADSHRYPARSTVTVDSCQT
jgi:hypothetical protein